MKIKDQTARSVLSDLDLQCPEKLLYLRFASNGIKRRDLKLLVYNKIILTYLMMNPTIWLINYRKFLIPITFHPDKMTVSNISFLRPF